MGASSSLENCSGIKPVGGSTPPPSARKKMNFLERFQKISQKVLGVLNEVPNCPTCHGTGEPTGKWMSWAETVWWKGKVYFVCHNCQGRGKV